MLEHFVFFVFFAFRSQMFLHPFFLRLFLFLKFLLCIFSFVQFSVTQGFPISEESYFFFSQHKFQTKIFFTYVTWAYAAVFLNMCAHFFITFPRSLSLSLFCFCFFFSFFVLKHLREVKLNPSPCSGTITTTINILVFFALVSKMYIGDVCKTQFIIDNFFWNCHLSSRVLTLSFSLYQRVYWRLSETEGVS